MKTGSWKRCGVLPALLLMTVLVQAQDVKEITTTDDWKNAMEAAAARKEQLRNSIEQLEKEITILTAKDSMLAAQVEKANTEFVAMVNQAETRRKEYEDLLRRVDGALSRLSAMARNQIPEHPIALDSVALLIDLEKASRLSQLEEYRQRLAEQQRQLDDLRSLLGAKSGEDGERVVVVGTWENDRACLWTIAGKKSVYGNPELWAKIWQANKATIENPDLIQPGQRLTIPPKSSLTKKELAALKEYNDRRTFDRARTFTETQKKD